MSLSDKFVFDAATAAAREMAKAEPCTAALLDVLVSLVGPAGPSPGSVASQQLEGSHSNRTVIKRESEAN